MTQHKAKLLELFEESYLKGGFRELNATSVSLYGVLLDVASLSSSKKKPKLIARPTMAAMVDKVQVTRKIISNHLKLLQSAGLLLLQYTPRNQHENYIIELLPLDGGQKNQNLNLIKDSYNKICKSYNKALRLTSQRIDAIELLSDRFTLKNIFTVFYKAENSRYLKKGAGEGLVGFDWLINEDNFIKVLEGYFDNRSPSQNNATSNELNEFWEARKEKQENENQQAHS